MSNNHFKVGDRVTAFGMNGSILKIHKELDILEVFFGVNHVEYFNLDGKINQRHKEPSLFRIGPKEITKVKKTLYVAINSKRSDYRRPAYQTTFAYENQADAAYMLTNTYTVVPVEVEVEGE